jgi:hypothetical protein
MPQADGKVLIVRHGMGRGRLPGYFNEALGFFERYQPKVHQRIALHQTGSPVPDLAGVRSVLFWLADPLRQLFPDCYTEAKQIADSALARGIRLVNPPDALSDTVKTRQSQLWRDAGIPTPESVPFATIEELRGILDRIAPPVIVRPSLTHAQQGVRICGSIDAALQAAKKILPAPALVAQLVDVRATWRAANPNNLYSRLFHTKRCFVFGSIVKTTYIQFSPVPVVAGPSCTFNANVREKMKLPPKPEPGTWDASCIAADYFFATGPAEAPELMLRAGKALGLEYFAVDYATRADGSHVLWEANPYLNMNPLGIASMREERRMPQRYALVFDALGKFLLELAAGRKA